MKKKMRTKRVSQVNFFIFSNRKKIESNDLKMKSTFSSGDVYEVCTEKKVTVKKEVER